jgi:hypothetical protein
VIHVAVDRKIATVLLVEVALPNLRDNLLYCQKANRDKSRRKNDDLKYQQRVCPVRSVETATYPGLNQIVGDEVPNRFDGCNCYSILRNVDFFVQYLTMMWRGISER